MDQLVPHPYCFGYLGGITHFYVNIMERITNGFIIFFCYKTILIKKKILGFYLGLPWIYTTVMVLWTGHGLFHKDSDTGTQFSLC